MGMLVAYVVSLVITVTVLFFLIYRFQNVEKKLAELEKWRDRHDVAHASKQMSEEDYEDWDSKNS